MGRGATLNAWNRRFFVLFFFLFFFFGVEPSTTLALKKTSDIRFNVGRVVPCIQKFCMIRTHFAFEKGSKELEKTRLSRFKFPSVKFKRKKAAVFLKA